MEENKNLKVRFGAFMDLPRYVNRPSLVWILHGNHSCSDSGC